MFKHQVIAAAVATTILTAACSGSPEQTSFAPAAPSVQNSLASQNAGATGPINTFAAIGSLKNVHHDRRSSWMMKPDVGGNALLYVSDAGRLLLYLVNYAGRTYACQNQQPHNPTIIE